ncbi:hypothetical protein [Anaerobaca lacustris]|uniref:Uncharacterized protein n=1 Tax=Anaerobaca lacustris TaxID=3044600 RepID=A0AAW6U0L6_9BACT|nr:hypothetical protein [Sedimentisphaerales bacterium M17dextr]
MIGTYVGHHFHQSIIWGITLQCFGVLIPLSQNRPILTVLGGVILFGGTLLTVMGFAAYTRTKGRSPAWSSLAFLSIIGWIILISLKPKQVCALTGDSSQRAT